MSSFPNCMSLVSFSCLIALARTSSTKLTSYGMSGQPCLVPHFSGTVLSFSPFNLCWLLAWCKLPLFSYVPCIPNLFIYGVRFFFQMPFLRLMRWSCDSLQFVCMVNYTYRFSCIEPFLHLWNESTLDDLFDMFMDSVSKYFIEYFCIIVHKGK